MSDLKFPRTLEHNEVGFHGRTEPELSTETFVMQPAAKGMLISPLGNSALTGKENLGTHCIPSACLSIIDTCVQSIEGAIEESYTALGSPIEGPLYRLRL